MTDIYDILGSLFTGIDFCHCPECGNAVVPLTAKEIGGILKKCVQWHKDTFSYNEF